jgi:hypothetical protein
MRARMDLKVTDGMLEILLDKKFNYKFDIAKGREIRGRNDLSTKIIFSDLQRVGVLDYLNQKVILEPYTFNKLMERNAKVVYFFLGISTFAEAFVSKNTCSARAEVILMMPEGVKRGVAIKDEDTREIRLLGEPEACRCAREALY